MDTRIANWGVELAFIRTQVGTEFDVAHSCSKIPSNNECRFFGTYGYFDLAAISCFNHLSNPYLVLLDSRIVESAPFRFFADVKNRSKDKFESDLDSWPAAIIVLVKISAKICDRDCGRARWIVADQIRREFPEAHVFFGLGHSELLIVTGGVNLPELLKAVTGQLRILVDIQDPSLPLFSKTTTFPLLSCKQIHSIPNYKILDGEFEPVVTASCEPAAERRIATELDDQGLFAKNVYGKNDLLIGWRRPIKTSELAKFLTDFRHKWGPNGMLKKTSTYLESSIPLERGDQKATAFNIIEKKGKYPDLMTEDEEVRLFEMLAKVKPQALRAALSDLTLRLSACLNDSQLTSHYRDMANIFAYLPDLVESLGKKEVAQNASFTAEAVADLARAAMNQRYAGLELHPETLAHAHAPLLCDIRTIVAAATCIPYYIFDRLKTNQPASELWAGFVLFGGSSSPQYLHYDILGLPPSSLFSPIDVWWKITHEVAHAIFKTLQVYEQIPEAIREYIAESVRESGFDDNHLINELFANWFDWKYVFNQEMEFYLRQIWVSWVRLPIVCKSKPQYLARSFGVFICPRLGELISLLPQRWDRGGLPWLEARWLEFVEILQTIPGMSDYLNNLGSSEKTDTLDIAYGVSRVLYFFEQSFEKKCGVENLQERLHPSYPRLNDHLRQLNDGYVITEGITDPCRLHLELLKLIDGKQPSLATEIAYLFSLENTYLKAQQKSGDI